MYKLLLLLTLSGVSLAGITQNIGIGTTTPNASAALDIRSTSKGLLIPTMTRVQRNAISNPATGLLIFQTDVTAGFYFNKGTPVSPVWTSLGTAANSGWQLGGNSGINPATDFIGTTDDQPLMFKVNNVKAGYVSGETQRYNTGLGFGVLNNNVDGAGTFGADNTAIGGRALTANTQGLENTAIGSHALTTNIQGSYNAASGANALYNNTSGSHNTAHGASAMGSNTTGHLNTAVGRAALTLNTTGSNNTAMGHIALASNSTGYSNVAIGTKALLNNRTGNNLVAVGDSALYSQSDGAIRNTAIGSKVLYANLTGDRLAAVGYQALMNNTSGSTNSAFGDIALATNTSGQSNTAIGATTMFGNTSGNGNTAIGASAMNSNTTGHYNTAVGTLAMSNGVSGSYNTFIGYTAGPNSGSNPSNFTAIGYNAGHIGSNSNTIEIGNSSVTWIGGQVNWSTYSDESIKDNIQPDVPGLTFIKKLRPVTYRLNIRRQDEICAIKDTTLSQRKYDIEQRIQTGFLAQEVERAAKEINYSFSGVTAPKDNAKLYSLSYAEFVVPLVKAVQEQQSIIEKQQQQISELVRDVKLLKEKISQ